MPSVTRKSCSPWANWQFSPSEQLPFKSALQSFVLWRFGADRNSEEVWAYLQVVEAHRPRSKKTHILVFVSCNATTVSFDNFELLPPCASPFGPVAGASGDLSGAGAGAANARRPAAAIVSDLGGQRL